MPCLRQRGRQGSRKTRAAGMKGTKLVPALIGVTCDSFEKDGLVYYSAGAKYVRAISDVARGLPVMIPALGDDGVLAATLGRLDAILITGAVSNVHPGRYGAAPTRDHEPYDVRRDAASIALIRGALARGLPMLCICRGTQELNVALGGSLDTQVQEIAGRLDHRSPPGDDLDVRYGPVHDIDIVPGGQLAAITGQQRITVNSVHCQAIATPAPGLTIEARAPDGTIEAVSVTGAKNFALAVQWHPEYKAGENPQSVRLFEAFGAAAAGYRAPDASAFGTAQAG